MIYDRCQSLGTLSWYTVCLKSLIDNFIVGSLNHLYNTWASSSFAYLSFVDHFRHYICTNLNCKPFHWRFVIIHRQGQFSFIILNIFSAKHHLHYLVSTFLPFWKFILIIVFGASKLHSLIVFFCKLSCSSFGFQILFLRASTFSLFPSLLFYFNCIIQNFVQLQSFFVFLTTTYYRRCSKWCWKRRCSLDL